MWGEMIRWWREYCCSMKEKMNLKSDVSGFMKNNITTNTILDKNQNFQIHFSKGFFQGIILTAISQPIESSLPKGIYRHPKHHHFPRDKTGGIIIMDRGTSTKLIHFLKTLTPMRYLNQPPLTDSWAPRVV